MDPWIIWLALAAFLAAAEMMTGTFYLLVLAVAAAAGAGIAQAGFAEAVQIGVAAVIGLAGSALVHHYRPQKGSAGAHENPDVNPDIGQVVRIASIAADGQITVSYRGTNWPAEVPGLTPQPGIYYVIKKVEGMKLILAPRT